jgi:hypothetical protein
MAALGTRSLGWLEREAHLGKGYASYIKNGQRKKLNPEMLSNIARALDVEMNWLATGLGPMRASPLERVDMPAGAFLLKLSERAELRAAINDAPERWRLSTVARALSETFQSDSRGVPLGGWAKVLDSIQEGRIDETSGAAANVIAATKKQIGRRPKLPSSSRRS